MAADPAAVMAALVTLRSLQPADLKRYPELKAEGLRLFERAVKVKCFGEENPDVVAFLREKEDYRALLKRLERVGAVVEEAHAVAVETSGSAAINQMRDARASEVNARGVAALSTQEGLLTLLEGLSVDTAPMRDRLLGSSDSACGSQQRIADDSSEAASVPAVVAAPGAAHYASGSDFRAGGIGRSRGRKAAFNLNRVRGLYDDPSLGEEDGDGDGREGPGVAAESGDGAKPGSTSSVRRKGVIYFVPRARPGDSNTAAGGGTGQPRLATAPGPDLHTLTTSVGSGHGKSTIESRAGTEYDGEGEGEGEGGVTPGQGTFCYVTHTRFTHNTRSHPPPPPHTHIYIPGVIPGLGMLCYIRDEEDGALRACALRTVVGAPPLPLASLSLVPRPVP